MPLNLAKVARPIAPGTLVEFRPRANAAEDVAPRQPTPTRTIPSRPAVATPNLIDDHEDLKVFYQALWRTESKLPGAVTRVLHYGDSPVTADSITADVRSLLQEHYGDAGHGFILIAKPWAWYGHRGVDILGKGWQIEAATQSHARDGLLGLGGVSFEGATGAASQMVLAEDHARMEVQYLPAAGRRAARRSHGGRELAGIETDDTTKQPGFQTVELPAGTATSICWWSAGRCAYSA